MIFLLILSLSSGFLCSSMEFGLNRKYPEIYFLKKDYSEFLKKHPLSSIDELLEAPLFHFLKSEKVKKQLTSDIESLQVLFGYENNSKVVKELKTLEKKVQSQTLSIKEYELISRLGSHADQIEMILSNLVKNRDVNFVKLNENGEVFLRNQNYKELTEYFSKKRRKPKSYSVVDKKRNFINGEYFFPNDGSWKSGYKAKFNIPVTDKCFLELYS